jgi:hypothetical protein
MTHLPSAHARGAAGADTHPTALSTSQRPTAGSSTAPVAMLVALRYLAARAIRRPLMVAPAVPGQD